MKTRSRAFYNYLSEAGMLNGTPEQIAIARREYRKRYKKTWRQGRNTTKEIRIEFTPEQFAAIQLHAATSHLAHTTLARNAILRAIGVERDVKKSPQLLTALQLVSMMINAALQEQRRESETLRQVETLLLQYLNVV